jgi:hypothetical protein
MLIQCQHITNKIAGAVVSLHSRPTPGNGHPISYHLQLMTTLIICYPKGKISTLKIFHDTNSIRKPFSDRTMSGLMQVFLTTMKDQKVQERKESLKNFNYIRVSQQSIKGYIRVSQQ